MSEYNIEVWKCNDMRLPFNEDMHREMPDPGFIASIANVGQLNPIIMARNAQVDGIQFDLVAGRARLMAIRALAQQGSGDGDIFVRVIDGLSPDDQAAITLIENAQRSINPVADFMALKSLLLKGATYAEIAKKIGMSVSYVKKLDQDFATVPDWALEGIQHGAMTANTAKALGNLSDKAKDECHVEMLTSPKKKLTMGMVQDKHRMIQADATMQVINLPGMSELRRVFTRTEIEYILVLINTDAAKASEYVDGLLQEAE
jgi:ParB-like chromosome segregation protein Spo0J